MPGAVCFVSKRAALERLQGLVFFLERVPACTLRDQGSVFDAEFIFVERGFDDVVPAGVDGELGLALLVDREGLGGFVEVEEFGRGASRNFHFFVWATRF